MVGCSVPNAQSAQELAPLIFVPQILHLHLRLHHQVVALVVIWHPASNCAPLMLASSQSAWVSAQSGALILLRAMMEKPVLTSKLACRVALQRASVIASLAAPENSHP